MAKRGACQNSVPGCWKPVGQGLKLGFGAWSSGNSGELGPAFDLVPRSVERSLIPDLGRTEGASTSDTARNGEADASRHGRIVPKYAYCAVGCQAGMYSRCAARCGRCYSIEGGMLRPRGYRVQVLAEIDDGKYSRVEVSLAWANALADHGVTLDKIRAKTKLQQRYRN